MNLSFFIAKRYLVSKKSNNAINIISWISIVAITFITAALVIILSAMNGLTDVVANLYNAVEPDIKISAKHGKYFKDDTLLFKKIQAIQGITTISKCVTDKALLKREDKQSIATIKGIDDAFVTITHFDTLVIDGVFKLKDKEITYGVFGRGLASNLGVNINDFLTSVSVYVPKRGKFEGLNPEDAFNKLNILPAGTFMLNDEFDFNYVVLDLKTTQALFDCQGQLSSLEIACDKNVNTDAIKKQLQKKFGDGYVVKNRYELNDVLFKTLETEKLWTFLILAFIMIIATFNIIGALTMLVIEKQKDIKTLYHLGATQQFIQGIFMREGLLITLLGAMSGLFLGLIVCICQMQFHFIKFDENYVIAYYPIKLQIMDFAGILLTVLVIGFIAALYPVRLFAVKQN